MLSALRLALHRSGGLPTGALAAACPTWTASVSTSSAVSAAPKRASSKPKSSSSKAAGSDGPSTSDPAGGSDRPKREPKPLDPNNSLQAQQKFRLKRSAWRRQVSILVKSWRVERRQKEAEAAGTPTSLEAALAAPASSILSPADALQQRRAATAAAEMDTLADTVEALAREKRKADVAREMAFFCLERAKASESRRRAELDRAQRRRNKLLDASRSWITRETLVERIEQALDEPQPFGFIATHRVQKGSAYAPGAAKGQTAGQRGTSEQDGPAVDADVKDDALGQGKGAAGSSKRATWWVV